MALKQHGVEPKHQDFYRSWVLGWLKFIRRNRFNEANMDDVRQCGTHILQGKRIKPMGSARALAAAL